MSKKLALALVLAGLVSACQQPQPPAPSTVVVAPEPVFQGRESLREGGLGDSEMGRSRTEVAVLSDRRKRPQLR